jgi:regulator of RNase E activity RraA
MKKAKLDSKDEKLFAKLKAANIESAWAALVGLGFPDTFINSLICIRPDLKMVGRARTLRYIPLRRDVQQMIKLPPLNTKSAEESEPGDIIVVDAHGCVEAGFTGDVVTTRFLVRGGAGMVVDGAVRDLHVIRQMDMPLYIKGAHAAASGRAIMGADYQVPIQCGGVTVIPGDILLGDSEGILVIPANLAEEVAEKALATDHKENFLRSVLEKGKRTIYETYPPNAEVQAEYEAHKKRESGRKGEGEKGRKR